MRSKKILRRELILIGFLVFAIFAISGFYFASKNSIKENLALSAVNATALYEQKKITFGLPMRLNIPKINVDSAVERVGLTSDGAMDVPKNQDNVAWFELGQRPGEDGSAVIAGHYGLKDGRASVFDNLHKLHKGDKLYIEDNNGVIISFVVRESRIYDPSADASDVFGSNDGKSHLNLIACEGIWDNASKSYPSRLVIFADKE